MTQSLKIGKLPDTTPVKHTISVEPDLDDILKTYAEIYEQTYGEKASVPALIPSMLRAFIASDSGFKKALRDAQLS
jgi:hypothetical protein